LLIYLIFECIFFYRLSVGLLGESSAVEMGTTKTIVKIPKFNLSANNVVIFLRRLEGRLRSSHPLKNALKLTNGKILLRKCKGAKN